MKTIHLQGLGEKPAVSAAELSVGNVTLWNYGNTETILGVVKETAKTMTFEVRCNRSGRICTRRMNKATLVALR